MTRNTSGANNAAYGTIATVSGSTITFGTSTALNAQAVGSTSADAEIATMSNTKVFFVWNYHIRAGSTSSYRMLGGLICSVSGSTITVGSITELSEYGTSYLAYTIARAPVIMPNGIGLVAYLGGRSSTQLSGTLFKISDTTVIRGSYMFKLATGTMSGTGERWRSNLYALSDDSILFMYAEEISTNGYLKYIVCRITSEYGLHITQLNDLYSLGIQIGRSTGSASISRPLLLPDKNVLIAHASASLPNTFYTVGAYLILRFGVMKASSAPPAAFNVLGIASEDSSGGYVNAIIP